MKKWTKGSFTVEAAMIMGVVLLVIVAVLEGSRIVYERAVEIAKEYEQSISEQENPEPVAFIRRAQLIKNMVNEE